MAIFSKSNKLLQLGCKFFRNSNTGSVCFWWFNGLKQQFGGFTPSANSLSNAIQSYIKKYVSCVNTEELVYFIVNNFLLYLFKSSKPCVIVGSGLVKYLKRKKKSKFNNLRCLYYEPFFFFLCIYVNQIYKYASLIHIKHLKQIIRYIYWLVVTIPQQHQQYSSTSRGLIIKPKTTTKLSQHISLIPHFCN